MSNDEDSFVVFVDILGTNNLAGCRGRVGTTACRTGGGLHGPALLTLEAACLPLKDAASRRTVVGIHRKVGSRHKVVGTECA